MIADTLHTVPTLTVTILGLRWCGLRATARALRVPLVFDNDACAATSAAVDPGLSASERRRAQLITVITRRLYDDRGCLRQALALGRVLGRHETAVRIGVRPGPAHAEVHAWVEVDGRPVGRGQGFAPLRHPA